MSNRDWNHTIDLIKSNKVKDREDGMIRYREFLSQTRYLDMLDQDPNHSWVKSLQALFELVLLERRDFIVKQTQKVEKRLADAVQLVQWTVQRVHLRVNRKTIKAIFSHLTQVIAVQGKLQHFALTYLKTLRFLLSYPPHLEHLDEEKQWPEIVSLCFAAVLGDKIKIGQELADDMAMDVDEGSTGEDEDGSSHHRPGKGALRRTADDDLFTTGAPVRRRTATQEDIELLGCIEAAFRSASAPFLRYSTVIFHKFLRFFRLFANETTAHVSALRALNRAFGELDLNDQKTMQSIGPLLWPHILDLWSTKNTILKEHVVMALKYLLPFVAPAHASEQDIETKIKPLFDAVMSEPTIRWRDGLDLSIDHLDLGLESANASSSSQVKPFQAKTFRIGFDFKKEHALAWTLLELGADSLARLYRLSELAHPSKNSGQSDPSHGNRKGKRRKIEDPLTSFIDSLTASDIFSVTCFRLQLALFLVERHWSALHIDVAHRILQAVVLLLGNDDVQVQSWAFVVLAAISEAGLEPAARSELASPSKRSRQSRPVVDGSHWDQPWTIALKRVSHAGVSRVAAHAANVMLGTDRVESPLVLTSIQALAQDLDIQSPSFPSDAVCTLLEWCLAITSSDVRLFRLDLPHKIFQWLSTSWKPLDGLVRSHSIGQARPRADPLSPTHLRSLVARICGIFELPNLPYTAAVPDCAVATMAVELSETAAIRAYIDGHVPPHHFGGSQSQSQKPSYRTPTTITSGAYTVPEGLERRVSLWLERILDGLVVGEDAVPRYWDMMGAESARRHLDLASLAIATEALFERHKMRPAVTTIKAACVVISKLAPGLASRRWHAPELALVLDGLSPLFVPLESAPAVSYTVLLDPSSSSGVPQHLIPPRRIARPSLEIGTPAFSFLHAVWNQANTRAVLQEVAEALSGILSGAARAGPSSREPSQAPSQRPPEQDVDDFGEIKVAKQPPGGSMGLDRAEANCMALCIRGLVTDAMADGAVGSVRVPQIVDAIIEAEGREAIIIAEQAFNAVSAGLLDFRPREASSVLDHFGGTLLPSYRFARDEKFALAALHFLECFGTAWIFDEGTADDDLGRKARVLCQWYSGSLQKGKLYSWRVRLRFMAFLDAYLAIDGTQALWNTSDEMVALPTGIIPTMLADDDFRVRFRAASSTPHLFTFMFDNQLDDSVLFNDLKAHLEHNLDNFERQLTQILCHANVFIASSRRRRAPFIFLTAAGKASSIFTPQIVGSLKGAALRLGLRDVKSLYMTYRTYHAFQIARGVVDAQSPHAIWGFSSLAEMRRADIRQFSTIMLLFGSQENFVTACNIVKRTTVSCTLECLPDLLAHVIARFTDAQSRQNAPWDTLKEKISEYLAFADAADAHQRDKLFNSVMDGIVAKMLCSIQDLEWPTVARHPALTTDPKTAEAFRQLLDLQQQSLIVGEISPPTYSVATVVSACNWLNIEYDTFRSIPIMFSAIRQIIARVHREPFTDVQQALLVGLSLAIALSHRVVRSSAPILGSITEGLIPLLATPNLVHVVASILRWSFTAWVTLAETSQESGGGNELCSNLVRAARFCGTSLQAVDIDRAVIDAVRNLANDAIRSLADFLAERMQQVTPLVDGVVATSAHLLWPWALVDVETKQLAKIEDALSTSFAPMSRFGLVRAFNEHPDFQTAANQAEILWKLLNVLNPGETLALPDCSAFADLLHTACGNVKPPPLNVLAGMSISLPANIIDDLSIQAALLSRLLDVFHESDQALVHIAFDSARAIFSGVPKVFDHFSRGQSPGNKRELGLLLGCSTLLRPDQVRARSPRTIAELDSETWAIRAREYGTWVIELAQLLADYRAEGEPFYAQLHVLVKTSQEFALAVLPLLAHSILLRDISRGENGSQTLLSAYFRQVLSDNRSESACVAAIVHIATYLRRNSRPDALDDFAGADVWLEVPWILLAAGAVKTGRHMAALLFLELAREYDGLFELSENGLPCDSARDRQAQDVLYDVYANIDEPDGFYGKQTDDVRESLVRRYRHEQRWSDAFAVYGAQFEAPSNKVAPTGEGSDSSSIGVVQSLASFGFNRLAMSIMQPARATGAISGDTLPAGLPYDLAWRTNVWDLPVQPRSSSTSSVALYSALRAVHTAREKDGLEDIVDCLLASEVSKLATVSLDLPDASEEVISTVLSLREVKRWASKNLGENLSESTAKSLASVSPNLKFDFAERVLSTRISLLRAIRSREHADQIGDVPSVLHQTASEAEQACLLRLSRSARQAGHLQSSMNAITSAHDLVNLHALDPRDVDEELASVLWAKGEHSTAIKLLKTITHDSGNTAKAALVLAKLGTWTSEAKMKTSTEILDDYFDPAVEALMHVEDFESRSQVFGMYACFADAQYQDQENTTQAKRTRFQLYSQLKEAELREYDRQIRDTTEGSGRRSQLERERRAARTYVDEDRRQLEALEASTARLLSTALTNYSQALAFGNDHDDKIFRFCALWLGNASNNTLHTSLSNDGIKGYEQSVLGRVPSHKYVFLAHQLSARLSSPSSPSPFAKNITQLVHRLCHDHPFHCLYSVHALRGTTGNGTPRGSRARRSSTSLSTDGEASQTPGRAKAAEGIFQKLKKHAGLRPRVEALELACYAYTDWASHDLKYDDDYQRDRKLRKAHFKIPSDRLIRSKLRDLPMPVSTFDLPLDPTGKYPLDSFPSIVKYDERYRTAGGVHLPKIVNCLGSDGKLYVQLLKGGDDIRQDAVMEQAFTLINKLLDRDEEARRRRLRLRTYRVIPLQSQSGLIEFVERTISVADILDPLYVKVKGSLAPSEARKRLSFWEQKRHSDSDWLVKKEEAFRDVLSKMPPVMRHFFYQRYKDPSMWFDMRLNYSRSVATTSIIGHIMGLGDRHVSNILMDTSSGDLIAIDLGIAFDQGKRLPIPELVPFRLTQNIVDGFGTNGVEGVFRRCSEEVLRVLRDRSAVVMTVLEVFKHDPLQQWAVSADMARRVQGSTTPDDEEAAVTLEELPDDADRALAIVAGKLDSKLSVEYTVNQLIQEATNPSHLGRIFCGWQPYL